MVLIRRPPQNSWHEVVSRLEKLEQRSGGRGEEGEWEDTELAQDVYATAFLLAKNATPGMYTFHPGKNKDMRCVWGCLLFIVVSQIFVLSIISVGFPPIVQSGSFLVSCDDQTDPSYVKYLELATSHPCESFPVAFSLSGKTLHEVSWEQYYYQAIFTHESWGTVVLQIVCCVWVLCAVYYRINERVSALFSYADFNNYFLPLKGEAVKDSVLPLFLPVLQWSVNTLVASVSCCVICGYTDAVDIVLNSLAFTFISEVPEYFNEPLVKFYSTEPIKNLSQGGQLDPAEYGTDPIQYLYPEYSEGNYSETGWYILKSHKRPGLLSDYVFRHDPSKYPGNASRIIPTLSSLFWVIPVLSVTCCKLFLSGRAFPTVQGC